MCNYVRNSDTFTPSNAYFEDDRLILKAKRPRKIPCCFLFSAELLIVKIYLCIPFSENFYRAKFGRQA